MISLFAMRHPSVSGSQSGFTIIEMSIALLIFALLIGSLLVPLSGHLENRKYDETQRTLLQAREALLGYVSAYGYLPCPASATSNGQEPSGTDHGTGICPASVTGTNAYVGFLPAVTLGFTPVDDEGFALDAFGLTQNRIRYAVANATVNGQDRPFTRSNGMRSAGMSNIMASSNLLFVCSTGSGVTGTGCSSSNATLSGNSIAVIWSLGVNAATGGAAPHEDKNLDGNRVFVMRTYSKASGGEFDDMLTWIAPPMLFSRMVSAGLLP
jgi:prepilin-type N-terminal cleavage/methylation domain-containing protein